MEPQPEPVVSPVEVEAGWEASKPTGGGAAEPEGGRSGLNNPEYYRADGELVTVSRGDTNPPVSESGRVSLNFAGADIREVIDVILGDTLGLNYIVDPQVQGTVVARTSEPLERQDVVPALESVLKLNGAALKLVKGVYHVVPLAQAARGLGASRSVLTARQRALGFAITVIPLRYASVNEVHKIAQPLVPPERILLTDPARNLMIFAGTGTEAEELVDLIRLFDVDWMAGMSFALFPVEVADVTTLVGELEQVFDQANGGALQGVVRFLPITRMNAVLAMSAQPDYLDHAGLWIERLDRGEGSAVRRIFVYHVQNSRAAELAEILSQVFSASELGISATVEGGLAPGLTPVELATPQLTEAAIEGGEPVPLEPPYSPVEGLAGEASVGALISETGDIRIIADERNNALVILATAAEYRMIEATLQRLDIVPLQVLIEATIAEVSLNDELQYGLQWFFQSDNVSTTFSALDSGLVTQTFPGFSFFLNSSNAQVALNALTDVTDVNVVSSPQLMVLDNQSALLNVGDQVPIATQTSTSTLDPDAPLVSTIEYRDTGVTLEITPRVNANGLVVLDIIQEVSDPIVTDTSNLDSPTIQQRRVESTVAVQSGSTIGLGGLIRDRRIDNINGIPILSEIPILGNLFKTTREQTFRTELLILITPTVVRNEIEAAGVTDELRMRMTGLSELEYRIQAPGGSGAAPAD